MQSPKTLLANTATKAASLTVLASVLDLYAAHIEGWKTKAGKPKIVTEPHLDEVRELAKAAGFWGCAHWDFNQYGNRDQTRSIIVRGSISNHGCSADVEVEFSGCAFRDWPRLVDEDCRYTPDAAERVRAVAEAVRKDAALLKSRTTPKAAEAWAAKVEKRKQAAETALKALNESLHGLGSGLSSKAVAWHLNTSDSVITCI